MSADSLEATAPARILVVEDQVSLLETLAYSLRREGYEVTTGPMAWRPSDWRMNKGRISWCWTSCCPASTASRCADVCVAK